MIPLMFLNGLKMGAKYQYRKVVKYIGGGSDAEALNLVTPAGLGEECLEDVDLESGLQQAISNVNKMRKKNSYMAMATTPTLSRTAYQNNRLNNM